MLMYTRYLSVVVYCWSGCWFTQETPPPASSVDNTDIGRADIWDMWKPNHVTGDAATAGVNKPATLWTF